MSNIELMAQAIDFIEANLKEPIAVNDMADAVSFSLYYFCRTFNEIVHHTPYDYLMRRRLAEAACELLHSDRKIIDIACEYRFNNPETFSRAFRRGFDTPPNELRKQGKIDSRRIMPRLTSAHLEHLQHVDLKPAPVEKPAFLLVGLVTLVNKDRAAISELWEWIAREFENCAQPDFYGITYYPAHWAERGCLYLAGMRIQSLEVSNPALVVKTIPASKYARFIHKGPAAELPLTLDYIYHTWLPQAGVRASFTTMLEYFGSDLRNADREREIYLPLED